MGGLSGSCGLRLPWQRQSRAADCLMLDESRCGRAARWSVWTRIQTLHCLCIGSLLSWWMDDSPVGGRYTKNSRFYWTEFQKTFLKFENLVDSCGLRGVAVIKKKEMVSREWGLYRQNERHFADFSQTPSPLTLKSHHYILPFFVSYRVRHWGRFWWVVTMVTSTRVVGGGTVWRHLATATSVR